MLSGKLLLAALVIAVAVTFIQWFFIGFVFHKYQALTPSTWRKESSRSYAWSTLLSLLFAFMFALIFSMWKSKFNGMNLVDGIKFGAMCWIAFSLPYEIGTAIYVNYSRLFTLGSCLSSFFGYLVAGAIAAELL